MTLFYYLEEAEHARVQTTAITSRCGGYHGSEETRPGLPSHEARPRIAPSLAQLLRHARPVFDISDGT